MVTIPTINMLIERVTNKPIHVSKSTNLVIAFNFASNDIELVGHN